MAECEFHIDKNKLWRCICREDATYQLVRNAADARRDTANALSSGFRTGIYHDHETGEKKGNTQPRYMAKTGRPRGIVPTGIVYTANYAAQKDNMLHNTLLKSL